MMGAKATIQGTVLGEGGGHGGGGGLRSAIYRKFTAIFQ